MLSTYPTNTSQVSDLCKMWQGWDVEFFSCAVSDLKSIKTAQEALPLNQEVLRRGKQCYFCSSIRSEQTLLWLRFPEFYNDLYFLLSIKVSLKPLPLNCTIVKISLGLERWVSRWALPVLTEKPETVLSTHMQVTASVTSSRGSSPSFGLCRYHICGYIYIHVGKHSYT